MSLCASVHSHTRGISRCVFAALSSVFSGLLWPSPRRSYHPLLFHSSRRGLLQFRSDYSEVLLIQSKLRIRAPHAPSEATWLSLCLNFPWLLHTVQNSAFSQVLFSFMRAPFHMTLPWSSKLFLTPHSSPKSSELSSNSTSPGSSQDGWFLSSPSSCCPQDSTQHIVGQWLASVSLCPDRPWTLKVSGSASLSFSTALCL